MRVSPQRVARRKEAYDVSGAISRGVVFFLGVLLLGTLFPARADIYNWQTGEVIPGTEDIEPGPGVRLWDWNTEDRNLRYADFAGLDLSNARFESHCEITPLMGRY